MAKEKPIRRGPKGGKKHTPGRDHDRKSHKKKAKRFQKKAQKRREALENDAREQWRVWDQLSEEQKRLREDLRPTLPRPDNEESE